MNKIIFFLIDGLADKPRKNTPLKLAKKPNINKFIRISFLAKFFPLKKTEWSKIGFASVSQTANLGILGYPVKNLYLKRGPIEAIGSDIEYQNEWLAIRFDFGTINEKMRVVDRRAGRNNFGIDKIVDDLQKIDFEVPFVIKRTYGHRGILIFKNIHSSESEFESTTIRAWSDEISNSDPLKIGKKVLRIKPLKKNELFSVETAKIVQKFLDITFEKLKNHTVNEERIKNGIMPVNYLLTREAGIRLPELNGAKLNNLFNSALVIAENGVVRGTCKLAGFETLTVPEIKLEEQFNFIFDAIEKNSEKYNLIYIHIKGVDEAGHDKNCGRKKEIIEIFDGYFGNLVEKLGIENFQYIITGDHITDCKNGQHKFGFVPVLFVGKNIKSNNPKEFSEISARTTIENIWNTY